MEKSLNYWRLLAIDDKLCCMRLWSLHPRYLDIKGLLAVWREGLLAQKVLQQQTKGYRNHPQLRRFYSSPNAIGVIGTYLRGIYYEATHRGYHFDKAKITQAEFIGQIPCTRGQLLYEWNHLRQKLRQRDAHRFQEMEGIEVPEPHPLFLVIDGDVENWEIRASHSAQ
jgi:hypothetical protein